MKVTLKEARESMGLTRRRVASEIGVTENTIVNWENGKTSPKLSLFLRLCKIYGRPMDSIIMP